MSELRPRPRQHTMQNYLAAELSSFSCVESKNKTSAKTKSTMSSLDPSIIQVASFKCRADIPLVCNMRKTIAFYEYFTTGFIIK